MIEQLAAWGRFYGDSMAKVEEAVVTNICETSALAVAKDLYPVPWMRID